MRIFWLIDFPLVTIEARVVDDWRCGGMNGAVVAAGGSGGGSLPICHVRPFLVRFGNEAGLRGGRNGGGS